MVRLRAGDGQPPPGSTGKGGLHIPPGKQVGFTLNLNDGGGYLWDIQYYLQVGQGTNYIYSGGLFCQVQGQNVQSNGQGWMNATGDEIEIGPWNRGSYQIYRRCKVYRDVAMARWLDIIVNSTSTVQNVPVRVYSCTNNTISGLSTASGGNSFTEKDWAFITEHAQGRPSLLHVVCGPKSKLRPSVQVTGNNIYVSYNLTVPAGGTTVLCYWESQGQTVAELQERMKKFQFPRMLSDLSPAVRKLIANVSVGTELEGLELDRSGTADAVLLKNEDAIFGSITNEKFSLEAFYGTLDLPAGQVIGFAGVAGQEDLVRAVLSGGQVLTGKLKQETLKVSLPIGGQLDIPFSRIRQCSYRISKEKPEEQPMKDPLILLRTGDRLAFDPAALKCTFQTRHGKIDLNGKDLLEVRLDNEEHGIHRAVFLNGSTLGGLLAQERISLPLRLGPDLNISRDVVQSIRFGDQTQESAGLAHASISNEDELFGRLADEAYVVATEFNTVTVKPANIVSLSFDAYEPARVAVRLWDGTTLRGRLQQQEVRFQILPGPVLHLNVGHVVGVECPSAVPPDQVTRLVEKYVGMLSAAAYKDRQEAQEALVRMGPSVVPLLGKYLKDNDPEVRQRISVILEQLGGSGAPPAPPQPGVKF